ncbi:GerAB/ArcD/ProY family transporter [Paenibacillus humicola]|uniref:GerAB/ArcD/ProY family transporter n=1 Tax=Paenibacillus humicola TaxID=3110540 RepID=UPI00237AD531|nr:endospore germination permease [Paenibacillus humicola]
MLEKGKISAAQMGIMMYPVVVSNADLMVPAMTAKEAARDLWMAPIIASLSGFILVYIIFQLSKLYPKQTIVEYAVLITGKIPGKIIGLLFLFYFAYNGGNILKQYGEFLVSIFLNRTPEVVIIGTMVLLCGFAVRGGVEVIGRTAQIFVPCVVILWITIIVLLVPDFKVNNMFPMLERGIVPPLRGAILVQPWFTHFGLLAMLLPYVADRENGLKAGTRWLAAIMVTLTVLDLTALFIFGAITATLSFPMMEATRYISIADFLEHLEAFVMTIWVAGTFVKISLFYYVLTIGSAQWLHLSDYRPVVWPLGFLLVVFGMWAPGVSELAAWWTSTAPFFANTIHFVIPLLLLLLGLLRRKLAANRRDTAR